MSGQQIRSCLSSMLGWLGIGLLVIFVIGNAYAALQMERANRDLLALAKQLGYTPDSHLYASLGSRDPNLVTGASVRTLDLYYVVDMDKIEFEKLLLRVDPSIYESFGSSERQWANFIAFIEKRGDSFAMPRYQVNAEDTYSWILSNGRILEIDLYEIPKSSSRPEYQGQKLTGSLINIGIDGGIIPVWMAFGVSSWGDRHGY